MGFLPHETSALLPSPSLVTNSTLFSNLQDWEVLVLGKLKWDLAAVIAHDFLALILHRLSLPSDRQALVKKHAQTFLALCATGKHSRHLFFVKFGKSDNFEGLG